MQTLQQQNIKQINYGGRKCEIIKIDTKQSSDEFQKSNRKQSIIQKQNISSVKPRL